MHWDGQFERRCEDAIAAVCDETAPRPARERAWHALLEAIGPEIEAWALSSPILRQARLATADDARAVLVATLERLNADRFANLRRYRSGRPAPTGDADVVDAVARLADDVPDQGTPWRAWLRTLVRYIERDHVRRRIGAGSARVKRSVTTDTDPLPTDGVAGERPPITDALALAAIVAEIRAYLRTFPDAMQRALERWLEDAEFTEIAAELAVDEPRARALVRAGQARLRERFRDRMPALFGA